MPTRDEAWDLVCEWTESDSLRKHMLAVETAVRAYARKFGADEETWAVAGLVHDLDYERYPDLETGHPRMAIEELRRRDYPEEVVHAVQSHAEFLGVPRESLLDKTLFACDELSGFIAACAYVRPEGIEGMKPKSVKKKLKQPSFAAGVNRDDVSTRWPSAPTSWASEDRERARTEVVPPLRMRTCVRAVGEPAGGEGPGAEAPAARRRRGGADVRRTRGARHPVPRGAREVRPQRGAEAIADAVPLDDQSVPRMLACMPLLPVG
jgi:putative nucleotidyltransferase with HDIG domain